jgi:hypothetical protein
MAYHGADFPRNLDATKLLPGEPMRLLSRYLSGLLLLLCAVSAGAQFAQYTTPGGPEGRPYDRKQRLAQEAESARVRLGAVRLAPTFSLRDVEYVKNLLGSAAGSPPADFTATARAGFRAYLPTGSRVIWTAYALPEYVWWQKESARRHLDGAYGAGVDGFWNHLVLRAEAGSDASQQILTAEVPRLTNVRSDHLIGSAELGLTGAFSAFASAGLTRQRTLGDPVKDPFVALLEALDRDERVERAGLRWRPGNWLFGLGVEHSDVSFANRAPGAVDRSNSGTAPVLEVARERGHLFFQADVAKRSLTAKQGAAFATYDKVTGHATLSYEITSKVELFGYLNRNLVYSLQPDYSYFDDLRHGLSLHLALGKHTRANFFGETGTLGYTAIVASAPHRHDDLVAYGGAITYDLTHGALLSLVGSSTRLTSNLPGAKRSIDTLGITFSLSAGATASAVGP